MEKSLTAIDMIERHSPVWVGVEVGIAPPPLVESGFLLGWPAPQVELNFRLCPSAKQLWNPRSGPPTVSRDLSIHHDWPVKKSIVILPVRLKGSSKCTSSNLLSPQGAHNKDIGSASQMLLTGVRLCLKGRLLLGLSCSIGIPEKCITVHFVQPG